jgi:protein-S-isoprenylcysteine O-methyltransferase Ste14
LKSPAYGLWLLVIINSAVFIIFAFSFTRPRTKRDWRSFGAFNAFVVALFTEMYGFPLTVYLLSGWLSSRYPGVNLLSHNNGHLWEVLYKAQREKGLATTGPYAYVRHPQYDGWVPAAVAYATHVDYVPHTGDYVYPAWPPRGARGAGRVWRGARPACCHYPCVLPTLGLD